MSRRFRTIIPKSAILFDTSYPGLTRRNFVIRVAKATPLTYEVVRHRKRRATTVRHFPFLEIGQSKQ